jgi:hypothetical protein
VHFRAFSVALLLNLLLGACGGGPSHSTPPVTSPKNPAPARDPLALPAGVPRTATGRADADVTRTIRAWADALRGGDVARASALWALPAKVQNSSPVLTLSTRDDVLLYNAALPCGAVVTATGSAPRGFTIVAFRLTNRRGGICGSGVGQSARTAILVRAGRIAGWYRLPDTQPGPVV